MAEELIEWPNVVALFHLEKGKNFSFPLELWQVILHIFLPLQFRMKSLLKDRLHIPFKVKIKLFHIALISSVHAVPQHGLKIQKPQLHGFLAHKTTRGFFLFQTMLLE